MWKPPRLLINDSCICAGRLEPRFNFRRELAFRPFQRRAPFWSEAAHRCRPCGHCSREPITTLCSHLRNASPDFQKKGIGAGLIQRNEVSGDHAAEEITARRVQRMQWQSVRCQRSKRAASALVTGNDHIAATSGISASRSGRRCRNRHPRSAALLGYTLSRRQRTARIRVTSGLFSRHCDAICHIHR